jgi:hypothetical protein
MSTTIRKVNPYSGMDAILKTVLDNIGLLQAKVGLTPENLALWTGNSMDSQFNNKYHQTPFTELEGIGLSSVAINQYDSDIDMLEYDSETISQILDVPEKGTAADYIAVLNKLERNAYSQNISCFDSRTTLMSTQVGRFIAEYWSEQIALGASSNWNNYLKGVTYTSSWAQASVRATVLFSQNESTMQATLTAAVVFTLADLSGILVK